MAEPASEWTAPQVIALTEEDGASEQDAAAIRNGVPVSVPGV